MKVAVALSGGVDSLVAAFLLKQQGHNVVGIHFITGYESEEHTLPSCAAGFIEKDFKSYKISSIADQLEISLEIIDCRNEFRKLVVDYFTKSYKHGDTPNPCLVCNQKIKFGIILNYAQKLGASQLATGHYAQIVKESSVKYRLLKGNDPRKDQSYFLAFLSRNQLQNACFPLGGMEKTDVKKLANENGFTPVTENESQDICFIKGQTYSHFLENQPGFTSEPGCIEDVNGNVIGNHNGLHMFTTGQRRGINCPAEQPFYVIRKDVRQNRLIVGTKDNLQATSCRVSGINWINDVPETEVNVSTKVRYQHQPAPSRLIPESRSNALIEFDHPQFALTPGQGAVFYINNEVIGGGWIESSDSV